MGRQITRGRAFENVTFESLPMNGMHCYVMVTFQLDHAALVFEVRSPGIDPTAMTTPKKSDTAVTEKFATLKLEATNAEQAVDSARVLVHAAKERLKQARAGLKAAKLQAKQSRKAFKAEKKLAKRSAKKTGKKSKKVVAKKTKTAA